MNPHGTGRGGHRGGHNGIGSGELPAHTGQLPGELADVVNPLEPVALVIHAPDVDIVHAVHYLIPPGSSVGNEIHVGVVNGTGGEDRHRVAHGHQIPGKAGLPGQGIIFRRHRVVVDEPNIHGATIVLSFAYPRITTANVSKIRAIS